MRFFFQLIWLTIVAGWVTTTLAQRPYPPLSNYTAEQAAHIKEQNYDIIQDDQGKLYFANTYGVLTFDGKKWKNIRDSIEHNVFSLAKGEAGRIYVGSVNQIGYFEPTDRHDYKYVPIELDTQLIKPSELRRVDKIIPKKNQIFFLTEEEIIIWNKKTQAASVIRTPYSFDTGLFSVRDTVYVHESHVGLFRLEGDSMVMAPHGAFFEDKFIYGLLPGNNKSTKLAVTFRSGIYKITPGGVTAWKTEADEFLKTKMAYCAIRLHNGWYAIGTLRGGTVIIDQAGKVRYKIDKAHGLLEDNTLALHQDRQHNLWIGLQKGSACFKLNAPFSYLNNKQNNLERIRCISKFEDRVYLGTTRGTYTYSVDPQDQRDVITLVDNINTFTRDFLQLQDTLFAASNGGVYQIHGDETKLIADKRARCMLIDLEQPRFMWIGTDEGLGCLKKMNGKWTFQKLIRGIDHNIKAISQDTSGVLWLGTQFNGVYRFEYNYQKDRPKKIERFFTGKGLPNTFTYPIHLKNQLVFRTGYGLYYFDKQAEKFHPFTRYSNNFYDKEGMAVWDVTTDTAGYTWVATSKRFGRLMPVKNGYRWDTTASLSIRNNEIRSIYADDKNNIWLGTYDHLIYCNPDKKVDFKPPYPTLLNNVQLNSDSTLMQGHLQTNEQPREIIYDLNTLTFQYALPDYLRPESNEFKTYLEGFDEHWSCWTSRSRKRYTNLPPGEYTFHVKSRNLYQQEAPAAAYTFYILPPWYRTYWAYAGYLFLFLGLTYGAVRVNVRRLRAHNKELDRMVQRKTTEVIRQNKRIKKQKNDLAEQNKKLAESNKKLNEAKEKAEESNRIKERFLANAAHELRTPLNAVVGMANLLSETEDTPKQQEYIKAIRLSTDTLLDIVRDVLDISKIEAGKISFNEQEFSLEDVLKGARNIVESNIKDRDIEYSENINDHIPPVLIGDPVRLNQILFNLLTNAMKFTSEGEINLNAELEKEQEKEVTLAITVSDTGEGISPEKLSSIFEPFAQAGKEVSLEHIGGTGLGLAITRQLIELQGGNIEVNSTPKKGTRIRFTLPFLKSNKTKLSEDKTEMPEQEKLRLSDLTFLMVEDNKMNQLVAKSILKKWDCAYEIVENGEDCIEELKAHPKQYDVILMDVRMPIMDGYEATHIIREEMDPPVRDLPIIAMTAHASEKEGEKCLEAGMNSYLFKPFEPEDLYKRLKDFLDD